MRSGDEATRASPQCSRFRRYLDGREIGVDDCGLVEIIGMSSQLWLHSRSNSRDPLFSGSAWRSARRAGCKTVGGDLLQRFEQILRQQRRQTERGLVQHQNVRPGHESAADRTICCSPPTSCVPAGACVRQGAGRVRAQARPSTSRFPRARFARRRVPDSLHGSSPNTPRPSGTSAYPARRSDARPSEIARPFMRISVPGSAARRRPP